MKFTPERTEKIINLIKAGNYKETAALASGICENTLYTWINEGKDKKSPAKEEFYESLKKAEAEAEARNIMVIQKASQTNWTAAAWWLERTKRDRYGRYEKKDVDVDVKTPVEIIINGTKENN